MLWAQNKAAVTWKERGLLGSVFGAAQVATSESFASERIFENFFQAISSYPDRMSSSKTHKWLMEPREFVHIASRHSKDTVYQISTLPSWAGLWPGAVDPLGERAMGPLTWVPHI